MSLRSSAKLKTIMGKEITVEKKNEEIYRSRSSGVSISDSSHPTQP